MRDFSLTVKPPSMDYDLYSCLVNPDTQL